MQEQREDPQGIDLCSPFIKLLRAVVWSHVHHSVNKSLLRSTITRIPTPQPGEENRNHPAKGRGCVPELLWLPGLVLPCAPRPLRLLNPRIIPAQAGGMLLEQACSGFLGCDALVVLMEIPSPLENWLCG